MKLKGKNGYNISYDELIPENSDIIIVAMHGFGGDKASGCIDLLEEKVYKKNIGLIRFDWPAHGESETNGENLTIENCLSDLDVVIDYVKKKNPYSKLVAFSTSFGGYLALLYNYYHRDVFNHIILRSPAIKMYNVMFDSILTDEQKIELQKNKWFYYGFERIIKITDKFINQLKVNDVLKLYEKQKLNYVSIIHGTEDDVVPISDSIDFANKHDCSIYYIEGADHRYKKNGELEKVIEKTVNILDNNMNK